MADASQALRLIDLMHRLTRSLVEDLRRHVDGVADLEMGQFVLLRAIVSGTTSPSELARELSTHPAALSRTITQLVRAGLIERHPAPGDSRRFVLGLTAHGHAVTDAIAARIRPDLQRRLDTLPGDDAEQLLTTIERVLATYTGGGPAQ